MQRKWKQCGNTWQCGASYVIRFVGPKAISNPKCGRNYHQTNVTSWIELSYGIMMLCSGFSLPKTQSRPNPRSFSSPQDVLPKPPAALVLLAVPGGHRCHRPAVPRRRRQDAAAGRVDAAEPEVQGMAQVDAVTWTSTWSFFGRNLGGCGWLNSSLTHKLSQQPLLSQFRALIGNFFFEYIITPITPITPNEIWELSW